VYTNQSALANYLQHSLEGADPLELTRMLYRGAVDALRGAISALAAGDVAERGRLITKSQLIVAELAAALDHDRGGELSANLAKLYDYVLHLIQNGNFEHQAAPLEEAQNLLAQLLSAWEACRPDSFPAGTPAEAESLSPSVSIAG
jgi:flagellar protein FliS